MKKEIELNLKLTEANPFEYQLPKTIMTILFNPLMAS